MIEENSSLIRQKVKIISPKIRLHQDIIFQPVARNTIIFGLITKKKYFGKNFQVCYRNTHIDGYFLLTYQIKKVLKNHFIVFSGKPVKAEQWIESRCMVLSELLSELQKYTVNSRYLEVVGTIFYKFKLPEVQINLHFG